MFNIPTKQLIVNSDLQAVLTKDVAGAYTTGYVTPTNLKGFIIQGWLGNTLGTELNVLQRATRILKTVASAGAAEVVTYVVTASANAAGSVLRLVYQSMNLSPVESQNVPLEKRYQIPANASTDAIGADIVSSLQLDDYCPVTISYNAGTDTLTLTSKVKGQKIRLYSDENLLAAVTVVTPGALPVETYDALKNINWARNVDIDRDVNFYPLPGVNYTQYYFEVVRVPAYQPGGNPIPSEKHNATVTAYAIWVADGATVLKAAMDLLVADVNVAVGS